MVLFNYANFYVHGNGVDTENTEMRK